MKALEEAKPQRSAVRTIGKPCLSSELSKSPLENRSKRASSAGRTLEDPQILRLCTSGPRISPEDSSSSTAATTTTITTTTATTTTTTTITHYYYYDDDDYYYFFFYDDY